MDTKKNGSMRSRIMDRAVFILLAASMPRQMGELTQANHSMALDFEDRFLMYKKVFRQPGEPYDDVVEATKNVKKVIGGVLEFCDVTGRLVRYAIYADFNNRIIAWENYLDMMARREVFRDHFVTEYASGYIAGTKSPYGLATGMMSNGNIENYVLWQTFKYKIAE